MNHPHVYIAQISHSRRCLESQGLRLHSALDPESGRDSTPRWLSSSLSQPSLHWQNVLRMSDGSPAIRNRVKEGPLSLSSGLHRSHSLRCTSRLNSSQPERTRGSTKTPTLRCAQAKTGLRSSPSRLSRENTCTDSCSHLVSKSYSRRV